MRASIFYRDCRAENRSVTTVSIIISKKPPFNSPGAIPAYSYLGVAAWPRQKSVRRALRCDGILPAKATKEGISYSLMPEDIREIKAYVEEHRQLSTPFDIVMEGETSGEDIKRAGALVVRRCSHDVLQKRRFGRYTFADQARDPQVE